MKEQILSRVLSERKCSLATYGRLVVLSLMMVVCAGVLGMATPAEAARAYTASISPTSTLVSQSKSYSVTITNSGDTSTIDHGTVVVPAGFTITGTPTATSAGNTFTVSQATNTLTYQASTSGDRLGLTESVSVNFTATAPASTVGSPFTVSTTALNNGAQTFTLSGAAPTITVTSNTAPVAVDDPGFTVNEDGDLFTAPTSVLDNDTDADADTLTAVLVSGPTNGSFVGTLNSDGTFEYVPNTNFNGTDSFTYKANDGNADSNVATVTITVNAVADSPVATGDTYNATEDTTLDSVASALPAVLANDTDGDGDPLTAVLDTDVSNGILVLNADGSFTYAPNADYNGTDSFTYHANDGTNDSNIVTVTFLIAAVNDAPVATADSFNVGEDGTLITSPASVLDNDTDTENDSLTAVLDSGPTNGSFNGTLNADGTFEYVPNANFNGTDSFTYHANDGTDDSNIVTVTITVTGVNDLPVAVADSYNATQDIQLNVNAATGVLANDTDAESDPLTAVLDTDVTNGILNLNADGSFDYTPNSGYSGPDSFTYFANDGNGNSVVSATVTITVAKTFTISGYVRVGNVTPVAGVNVTRTGGVTVQTDSTGKFSFTGLLPGGYLITPSSASYTFSPTATGLLVSTANRACNFNATAIPPVFSITGRVITTDNVGIGGVTVARDGSGSGTSAVTNSAGYYTLSNVSNGSYNLTATLAGHTFSPAPRVVTVVGANVSGANFTSGFTISGRVSTSGGVGIGGVVISTGGGPTATSNSAGYYTIHRVQPGVIILTPTLAGSTFTPGNPTVNVTTANVGGQSFIRITGP